MWEASDYQHKAGWLGPTRLRGHEKYLDSKTYPQSPFVPPSFQHDLIIVILCHALTPRCPTRPDRYQGSAEQAVLLGPRIISQIKFDQAIDTS